MRFITYIMQVILCTHVGILKHIVVVMVLPVTWWLFLMWKLSRFQMTSIIDPPFWIFILLLKILNFAKYDGTALFCYLYWPLTKCLEIHLSAAVLLYSCNLIIKKNAQFHLVTSWHLRDLTDLRKNIWGKFLVSSF